MEVMCLVSGGKDSVLALWLALHQYNVTSVFTIRSTCLDSLLFHLPNSENVSLVIDMLGLSHRVIWIDKCEIKDEIQILKEAFIESGADAVITGGIRSEFQRFKFNRAAQLANMKCLNPLWRLSSKILLSELIENNFHIIISSVSGMGLKKDLLGKKLTFKVLEELAKNFSEPENVLVGEGGEYESFVLDAPFFPSRIEILESEIHWNEFREEGMYKIVRARLVSKN
ncbi:MAG: Dph6-related ATP pyrophosphatase [Candidatus Hodarchaeales archaeon]|jgi:predicted ATP pyrophosphatase (TIGR00289 family)